METQSFSQYINSLPKSPLTEAVSALYESASRILYHFLKADRFCQILETNKFTPSATEQRYNGDGKRFMSFTRHGNFNEGYPTMLYADGGIGDTWCKIRLTVDGDMFNRKPNFHTDDRKQHSIKVKPFDWIHHVYKGTPMEKEYPTGRAFTIADGDPMIDYSTMKEVTDDSHPFFQTEDRLITDAEYIPNALDYILKIDIILYVNDFDRRNQELRERLYNDIKNANTGKIHVYNGMDQFKSGVECSPSVLTAPCENRAVKQNKRTLNPDGSVSYEYRSYPRAVTEAANVNIDDNLAAKFATTSREIHKAATWVANQIKDYGQEFIDWMKSKLDDPESKYNATLAFKFADMGLSEDFVKGVPATLYLRFVRPKNSSHYTNGAMAYTDAAALLSDIDFNEVWPEDALIGIYVYDNMETIESIYATILWNLPHELRHVVDCCDKATLDVMNTCLTNNRLSAMTSDNFSKYWDDVGEYQARLSQVIAQVFRILENPNNRAKARSAEHVVETLQLKSDIYKEAVGDVSNEAKAIFDKNLTAIIAYVMDKLI